MDNIRRATIFLEGEHCHKAVHVPDEVRARRQHRWKNGWGFVVQLGDEVRYAYRRVPIKSFLNLFAARKAFIYVLEIFAQLMAASVFAKRLPQLWIAWIDNTAGEAALKKGSGKDPRVNGILASFWALAARQAWSPEFNKVSSAANISEAVSRGDLRQWVGVNFRFPLSTSSPSWRGPPTTSTTPTPARSTTCSV